MGCRASYYARIIRTYNPGIGWGGVGNVFASNHISDAPHNGMLGGGVLNSFINNTLEHLCFEATDSGAWYAGRSWTNRGNLLQGNTFRNIRNEEHMTLGSPSVQAGGLLQSVTTRVDDGAQLIYGHIIRPRGAVAFMK